MQRSSAAGREHISDFDEIKSCALMPVINETETSLDVSHEVHRPCAAATPTYGIRSVAYTIFIHKTGNICSGIRREKTSSHSINFLIITFMFKITINAANGWF